MQQTQYRQHSGLQFSLRKVFFIITCSYFGICVGKTQVKKDTCTYNTCVKELSMLFLSVCLYLYIWCGYNLLNAGLLKTLMKRLYTNKEVHKKALMHGALCHT